MKFVKPGLQAIFVLMLIASEASVFFIPQKVEAAAPVVQDNKVFISLPDAYIEASPATLTASGWVDVVFWTRNYEGAVDVVYGFNGLDNVKAINPESWETYEATKTRQVDAILTAEFKPEKVISTNTLAKVPLVADTDLSLNSKYAEIVYEQADPMTSKTTQQTKKLAYDTYDDITGAYLYKYNGTQSQEYKEVVTDWNKKAQPSTVQLDYAEAKKWDIAQHKTVKRNEPQMTRVWIDIPFMGKDTVTGKYNIGIKPSSLTLQQAKDQGKLWLLDPWYSSSWLYRKELTVYGSSAGVQTNYQKLIRVYKADAGADMPENLAQYTANDDDSAYNISAGTTYVYQTFTAEATATAKKIWLKIFRSGAAPSGTPTVTLWTANSGTSKPTATMGVSGTITCAYLSTVADWYEFDLGAGAALTSGNYYAIVVSFAAAAANNLIYFRSDASIPAYTNGTIGYSLDSGATWVAQPTLDMMFQVLSSTAGTVPLRVDTEAHCLANFNDLRFTKADGTTLLDYWIENSATCAADGYADCWVELDTIAQMTSLTEHTHYYLYYGNAGAASASNIANMAVFGDDFNRANNTTVGNGWVEIETVGPYSISGNALYFVGGGGAGSHCRQAVTGGVQYVVVSYHKSDDTASYDSIYTSISNYISGLSIGPGAGFFNYLSTAGWVASSIPAVVNTYYKMESLFGTQLNAHWVNQVQVVYGVSPAANPPSTPYFGPGFSSGGGPWETYTDWIFIRKWVVSQPLWGTAGAELSLTAPTVVTGLCTGTGGNWAIVNGNMTVLATGDGTTFNATSRGFNYGLTGAYGSTSSTTGDYPIGAFSALLTGLAPATTYHYRAFASVPAITGYGADATFTTSGAVTCHTVFETATTADEDVYGINWIGQSFTTPLGMPYTVKNVSINCVKVGAPTGTVTLGIYRATSGVPYGQVLTSGTFSMVNVPTATNSWYGCTVTEISLEPNTQYALVASLPDGTAAAYLQWNNVAAGGYTGGNSAASANSGTDWVADTHDMLFRICGNPVLQIQDVKVFQTYRQTNDWLVTVRYVNLYPPYYDTYDVKKYFTLQLVDSTATVKASSPIPSWGNRVGNIYLSAATTTPLTYGGDYRVRIYGTFTGNPYVEYSIQATDWMGNDLVNLDSWVITSASVIGTYYSTAMTTYIAERGEVLNSTGAGIFSAGIAGLSTVRPAIFQTYTIPSTYTPGVITQAGRLGIPAWQTNIGTEGTIMLTRLGNIVGIGGDIIAIIFMLIAFFILMGLAFPAGNTTAALVLSLPILGAAIWFGMDLIYIGILALVAAFLFIKNFWLDKGN
jgi:hypothetical protein